ncbi:uncharacterized protein [Triticum aestivum]|uniref:uncharacterized protein n=1 Tax=Triticum aestivum TaxID=4565 RepID=UPI001D0119B2|nr:uncharacterized protein LOC123139097 [Triticum aestivum]
MDDVDAAAATDPRGRLSRRRTPMDDVDAAAVTDPRGRRRRRRPVQSAVTFSARPYGPSLRLRSPIMAATSVGRNDSPMAPEDSTVSSRLGEVKINLDGTGVANYSIGISFLDYILDCNQSLWICQRVLLHMVIVVLLESWKQNHRRCCTI